VAQGQTKLLYPVSPRDAVISLSCRRLLAPAQLQQEFLISEMGLRGSGCGAAIVMRQSRLE
jgi:hypothetical protein